MVLKDMFVLSQEYEEKYRKRVDPSPCSLLGFHRVGCASNKLAQVSSQNNIVKSFATCLLSKAQPRFAQ